MAIDSAIIQLAGYGLASAAYAVLSILLIVNYRGRLRSGLLAAAAAVTAVWAAVMIFDGTSRPLSPGGMLLVESVHDGMWIAFMAALLAGAVDAGRLLVLRFGGVVLIAVLIAAGIYDVILSGSGASSVNSASFVIFGSILSSLFVLVTLEQIYRNSRKSQRSGLVYLCLGVGGIFAFDLLLYSNAVLVGEVSYLLWGARGFVTALCAPLIAIAAKKSPNWSAGIFVSRQIVFYTATLFGAGIYLTVVGFVGYYIRTLGGSWGPVIQVVFLFVALISLLSLLFSEALRSRARVFIAKHFYENKYEYRVEWLRLITTLTDSSDGLPLKKRAIKSLAQILTSPSGVLWLADKDSETYECIAGWDVTPAGSSMGSECGLARFLARTGWVVDLKQYADEPNRYDSLEIDLMNLGLREPGYIIPLLHQEQLLGFVVLTAPSPMNGLNFEDRDLLKTAGKQVASFLAQELASERLSESRQFEAFNRLTAYLMHDLKNVIAQQSLIVENAPKHRNNPDFFDDAVETIRGSVARMKGIVNHISQNSVASQHEKVEMSKLIMQAVSQSSNRLPVPDSQIGTERVWIRANRERLLMAVTNAIQNAQDATRSDGVVLVELRTTTSCCIVSISDDGVGMDKEFIRQKLFKPFESTKGTMGMGIGAYQIRETVRACGGEIEVESEKNRGTRLTMRFNRETEVAA